MYTLIFERLTCVFVDFYILDSFYRAFQPMLEKELNCNDTAVSKTFVATLTPGVNLACCLLSVVKLI